jgi:hypothetical protein
MMPRRDAKGGYSGTPLAKKLGLKSPMALLAIDAPKEYRSWLGDLPDGVTIGATAKRPLSAVHVFAMKRAALERQLAELRAQIQPGGFVWVSWPKKASKVDTDITEDTIRGIALPLGFVDIKVCAVSDVWSGLKLVIRKASRPKT